MPNLIVSAQRQAGYVEEIFAALNSDSSVTQQQIAEQLGISQQRVSQLYRQALRQMSWRSAERTRELMLLDMDEMRDKALEIMRADHPYVSEGRVVYPIVGHDEAGKPIYGDKPLQDSKGPLQAINTAVTVMKRMADTLGTDAPKKSEVVSAHVSAADLRVTKIVDSLRVDNDDARAAIEARVGARRQAAPGEVVDARQFEPVRRPHTAATRRRAGLGASPKRVASWRPDELFE